MLAHPFRYVVFATLRKRACPWKYGPCMSDVACRGESRFAKEQDNGAPEHRPSPRRPDAIGGKQDQNQIELRRETHAVSRNCEIEEIGAEYVERDEGRRATQEHRPSHLFTAFGNEETDNAEHQD